MVATTPAGISYGNITCRPNQSATTIIIAPNNAPYPNCCLGNRAPSINAKWGASNPTKLKGPKVKVATAVKTDAKTTNTNRAHATDTPLAEATTAFKPNKPNHRCIGNATHKPTIATASKTHDIVGDTA